MKFYEFNDFEYYALIIANDEENAMLGYEEIVADLEEDEKELSPDVIDYNEALERYKKGNIEGCETEEDKINDFNENVDNFSRYVSSWKEPWTVLLIDGSLI
ncbi:hypothetical protein SAMN02745163_02076 [Clostridium cavendishii DSM 21758]|uniref:Uncharacterized protein n=1 Tax=Clostridium cavendishii DSM 21758 TaxID=1121302 RepID=A0A1M6K231_9CLOT|nr:hypothetical protein [Clostridium cavendishii]SHJ52975.1 hypothetical protein SAMN02745163_02076 [Clostridium cavendishii DSM 21758]